MYESPASKKERERSDQVLDGSIRRVHQSNKWKKIILIILVVLAALFFLNAFSVFMLWFMETMNWVEVEYR